LPCELPGRFGRARQPTRHRSLALGGSQTVELEFLVSGEEVDRPLDSV
jgi:hypothetical protein